MKLKGKKFDHEVTIYAEILFSANYRSFLLAWACDEVTYQACLPELEIDYLNDWVLFLF